MNDQINGRLEKLVELWNLQLEGKLDVENQGQFDAMMLDAELVEQLAQRQAEKASAEPEPVINWKRLDKRIGRLSLKGGPDKAMLLVALAMFGIIGGIMMLLYEPEIGGTPGWTDVPAPIAQGGFKQVQPRRQVVSKPSNGPTLGPPPSVTNPLEVTASGSGIEIFVEQGRGGSAKVEVVDLRGVTVALLYSGPLDQGRWIFKWDGQMADGYKANRGSYNVQLTNDQGISTQPLKLLHTR